MYSPVRVAAPAVTPVSLDETKKHLLVDSTFQDYLITTLIEAATAHLDGWTGILGRCICEQTWRQDFDGFCSEMRLGLGPVLEVVSVTSRNAAGQISTVAADNYLLRTDELSGYVRFRDAFSAPSDLGESAAVSVTYRAGYANVGADPVRSGAPAQIKAAILLLVGHWYANREAVVTGTIATQLPMAVDALLAPLRRVGI